MRLISSLFVLFACTSAFAAPQPGLLFYLSGDKQFNADIAAPGTAEPNYIRDVTMIADGAKGQGFSCANTQLMAYWAPGNIYAQRGTLAFSWRSRDPVGPTQFPIFRVAYEDHSSWDMVWLRIDYNGHGFDAFVTDASLSRTRVSVTLDPFPKPNEWTHLALAWDETRGIRFYVNGKLAASKEASGVRYDAALNQFGPHSRIISPYQVQSDYNFMRGGDIDEIRIYDRMISDQNVTAIAKGDEAGELPALPPRELSQQQWRDEWWHRYGWDRPNSPPPYLEGAAVSVRKVEIHDVYDLKRWWWKGTDGIRETTWPGVYNRSHLAGRWDYFTLPDWDCYVESGKQVTFTMPNEPWNQIEISGSAWGKMELLKADGLAQSILFERPRGFEKTVNRLTQPITGQKIRFTNVEQEEPIGELSAYNVTAAREPQGSVRLQFSFSGKNTPDVSSNAIAEFIKGRYAPDERSMLIAAPVTNRTITFSPSTDKSSLPLVHLLIPDTWDQIDGGLDGILINLPPLNVRPTHGDLFSMNIQVKDPLWLHRDMMDFSFSVKPGETKTLWLDLRDRILPTQRSFLIDIAGAGPDFNASMLEGMFATLVFKPKDAARPEHEIDRFTQARDSYAMLTEEHPRSPKLDLWNRFEADITDLLKVNPTHNPGQSYGAVYQMVPRPTVKLADPPAGVPGWAFRQVELLGRVKHFVEYYIDKRQVDYGDFGGGISDDVDLLNTWPGTAFMGVDPEKLTKSEHSLLEAAYKNGMFTNGLGTIQADELHSYEEGINCLAQNLILDFGNPRQIERAMETARGIEGVTGINSAGHRHIRSSYYSGTKIAEDGPWGWSKPYSTLVLQVPQLLVEYNGNPHTKQIMLELADGLLAHRKPTGNGGFSIPANIHFVDDAENNAGGRGFFPWHVFWTAWKWTGDKKYLDALNDGGNIMSINANVLDILDLRKDMAAGARAGGRGRGGGGTTAWQLSGDKSNLESSYRSQIEDADVNDFINTEGSLWIDRVNVPYADVQRTRLGGVALARNALFPGHTVSWKFQSPANDQSVAILVPDGTPKSFKVIAYNLQTQPVHATMTGWNIDPGMWDISQGIDTNDDDVADQATTNRSENFERSSSLEFTFAPRAATILTLKLKTPGTPYWQRPDLGISRDDVVASANSIDVTVHSIGSVDAPASTLSLLDASGKVVASAPIPALKAPLDLMPKTTKVTLNAKPIPGGSIVIDPDSKIEQITRMNDRVGL